MTSMEAPAPTSTSTSDQTPSSPISTCPTFIVRVDVDDNDYDASISIGPDQDADGGSDRRSCCRTAVAYTILAAIAISGIVYAIGYPKSSDSLRHDDLHTDVIFHSRIIKLCAITDFPEDCVSLLFNYSGDRETADSISLTAFSVNVAVQEAVAARNYLIAAPLMNEGDSPAALEDCDELLALAHEQLLKVRSEVDAFYAYTDYPLNDANIKNALSAALALEVACGEGFGFGNIGRSSSVATNADIVRNATVSARISLSLVSQMLSTRREQQQEPEMEMRGQLRISWSPANGTKPDVVVANDGSGDVLTISEALKRAAGRSSGRFVIYVKAGVYQEIVRVTADMAQMTIYGDGPSLTVVTGNLSVATGLSYYETATFAVAGEAFMAQGIRFENTATATTGAAAALRVESDLAAFYDCHVEAYHGTLHVVAHRHFFRDCTVTGAVDVITGDAAAVLQNSRVALRRPPEGQSAVVAAQTRTDCNEVTGIVLQNCSVQAAAGDEVLDWGATSAAALLGRAAGECARAVVMETELGEVVAAEGWASASAPAPAGGNVYFGEFKNRGPSAGRQEMTSAEEAAAYSVESFIQGHLWLNATGIPFYTGLLSSEATTYG